MRLREPSCIVVLALATLAGCDRTSATPAKPTAASVDASATASSAASPPIAPDAAVRGTCTLDREGGVAIPDAARATQIRIAAAGSRALVTYWESKKRSEGPDVDSAFAHVFDASTSAVGPRTKIEENDVGDMPVSAAAPIAFAGDLFAIACAWAAPAGTYACTRAKPGEKPTTLFAFTGITTGGPEKPDIAAVVKGDDTLVVVPVGGDLQLFSARVSAKKKDSPFGLATDDGHGAAPDAFAVTLTADDEATLVYRHAGAVKARRAGFDQKWRGRAIDLSAKGTLVGAPSVASEAGHVVALFSQRAKVSDPWKVVLAEISSSGEVTRSALSTGVDEAQGPGIAKAAEPGCFHVSWVEGTGKSTRTKLARACHGTIVPSSLTTLSSAGIEGGRAYLATDPASPTALFAVWQEIPADRAAELRVGRLTCR
jgi:hypothetical protein